MPSMPADADGQVVEAVVIEVAHRQGGTELIPGAGHAVDAGAVLVPDLVARGAQAGGRAVDDVDGPGVDDGADVLARDADGQVVEAVVIEVPHRQGGPELIPGAGHAVDAG